MCHEKCLEKEHPHSLPVGDFIGNWIHPRDIFHDSYGEIISIFIDQPIRCEDETRPEILDMNVSLLLFKAEAAVRICGSQ